MTTSDPNANSLTIVAGSSLALPSNSSLTSNYGPALQVGAGPDSTIVNAGGIAGNAVHGQGVYLLGGGTLINSGTISGSYAASLLGRSTVVNRGAIRGGSGSFDSGLYLNGGGYVLNDAAGRISGHAGIELVHAGTVVNLGSIEGSGVVGYGVQALGGGVLVNTGTIMATASLADGVRFAGTYNNVTNTGTIIGERSGVEMARGGTIEVGIGGLVSGGGAGVSLANGPATLINYGTIAGPDAVRAAPGSPAFVDLYPSGTFVGTVDGGNVPGSTVASYLELGLGAHPGTLSGIGTQFVNFSYVGVRGTWTLAGSALLAPNVTLHDQGRLMLATPLRGPGTVSLAAGVTLGALPGDAPRGVIAGLGGAALDLVGQSETVASYAGGVLSLTGDQNIYLFLVGDAGKTFHSLPDGNGGTLITANTGGQANPSANCFARGTLILGPEGGRKVEQLRAGDLVVTASGRIAALRWVGRRRIDLRRHPRAADVEPIRVRADAFGHGLPVRDLVLSPDHAVLVDGALIPIRHLANGRSIAAEARAEVTYFHLELDRHDALIAEGLVCEFYLDTGNRDAFEGEGVLQLHPEFAPQEAAMAIWAARGCAPILTDPADPAIRAAHLRLAARERRAAARQGAAVSTVTL